MVTKGCLWLNCHFLQPHSTIAAWQMNVPIPFASSNVLVVVLAVNLWQPHLEYGEIFSMALTEPLLLTKFTQWKRKQHWFGSLEKHPCSCPQLVSLPLLDIWRIYLFGKHELKYFQKFFSCCYFIFALFHSLANPKEIYISLVFFRNRNECQKYHICEVTGYL